SMPPGCASHATIPHKRPSQSAILMRAYCLATSHSPVASVGVRPGCANAIPHAISDSAAQKAERWTVFGLIRIYTSDATPNSLGLLGRNSENGRNDAQFPTLD